MDHDNRKGREEKDDSRSDYNDRHGDDDCSHRDRSHDERLLAADDPVDWLKHTISDITEEAFHDLVFDKVKVLLDKKMGEQIDDVAELVVAHFVKVRQMEVEMAVDEADLNKKIRKVVRKKK